MANYIQPMTEQFNMQHTKKHRWQKFVTFMAAVVVFCTTYALIIPAITWERTLICEQPEHQHTDECYELVEIAAETVLSCQLEEHVHTDECFNEANELICGCEEHTHDEDCYTEIPARTESRLVCGLEEHVHDDSCFDAPPAEEEIYFCEKVSHTHNENCYFEDGTLKCTIEEHVHTAECEIDPKAEPEAEEILFAEGEVIESTEIEVPDTERILLTTDASITARPFLQLQCRILKEAHER